MKKIYFIISIALLFAMLLSACQPNPETPPVVSKNDGTVENAISNGAGDDYAFSAPASCPEISETYYDGRLITECGADARIITPDKSTFAVYEAMAEGFSSDIIDFINESCFQGAEMYEHDAPMTKEELRVSRLIPWQEKLWELEQGNRPEPYSYYIETEGGFMDDGGNIYTMDDFIADAKERIKEIEKEIAQAPDTSEPRVVTSDSYNPNEPYEANFDVDIPLPSGAVGRIAVSDNSCMKVSFGKYVVEYNYVGTLETSEIELNSTLPEGQDVTEYILENSGYSDDERAVAMLTKDKASSARAAAADFLRDTLKMDGMEDIGFGMVNAYDTEGSPLFYAVDFVRTVDGVPLKMTDDIMSKTRLYSEFDDTIIRYENIVVFLDEEGVCGFTWLQPLTIKRTAQESVELKDFDSVAKNGLQGVHNRTTYITKKMEADGERPFGGDRYIYEHSDSALKFTATTYDLGYMMIRKKDDPKVWYLMPTWCVNYTCTDVDLKDGSPIGTPYVYQQLINAVDGSAVNVEQGY